MVGFWVKLGGDCGGGGGDGGAEGEGRVLV